MYGNDDNSAMMSGAFSGALSGAAVGGPVGAVAGGVLGGALGLYSSSRQRSAQNQAMKEAERLRNQSLFREMMLRQQRDQSIAAGAVRSSAANRGGQGANSGVNTSTGFLSGAVAQSENSSGSSGTF